MSAARKRGKRILTIPKKYGPVERNIGHSVRTNDFHRAIPPFESDKNGFTRQSAAFEAYKVNMKAEYDAENSQRAAMDAVQTGGAHKNRLELFTCPHCSLCFVHPKRFLIHFKWHFFGIKKVKLDTKVNYRKNGVNKKRVFYCFCSEPFGTTKKLEDHIKKEHGVSETTEKNNQSILLKKNFILDNGSIYDLKAEMDRKKMARQKQQKEYKRRYRKNETEEQRKIRKEKHQKRLMKETEEERIARLKRHAEKVRLTRKKETEEQLRARKERYIKRMQNEPEEKRKARLERQREYARMRKQHDEEKQNFQFDY